MVTIRAHGITLLVWIQARLVTILKQKAHCLNIMTEEMNKLISICIRLFLCLFSLMQDRFCYRMKHCLLSSRGDTLAGLQCYPKMSLILHLL